MEHACINRRKGQQLGGGQFRLPSDRTGSEAERRWHSARADDWDWRPAAKLDAFGVACRLPQVGLSGQHTGASAQEGRSLLSPSSFQKMKSSASPPMRGSATGGGQKERRGMGWASRTEAGSMGITFEVQTVEGCVGVACGSGWPASCT